MTRMKRNNPHYSIETGGNPLNDPHATFPIEEPSQADKEAEAKRRATELIENFLSGKDRSAKNKCEILDAMTCDKTFIAALNLVQVSQSRDSTKCASKYFDALQRYTECLKAHLYSEMLFDIEHQ